MSNVSRSFPVKNMTCAACARSVENMLKFTPGVVDASVNYASATVNVNYNDDEVDFSKMQEQVQAIGYDLIEEIDVEAIKLERERELKTAQSRLVVAILFSVPVFLLSMVFTSVPYDTYIMLFLSLPVVFYSGGHFYTSAFKKARHRQFTMDTLIALGTGAAMVLSIINTFFVLGGDEQLMQSHVYFESAVVIITLILVGQYIEEKAKSSTTAAIEKLMNLQPAKACRIKDGVEEEVAVEDVELEDILRVPVGSKIPVDGIVVSGETEVDESMLTGESQLVTKANGDFLSTGTLNGSGAITMKATQIGAGTVLAGIIRMVQQAQGSKAPAQKLADKISGVFVPIVISIALIAGAVWFFVGPEPQFFNAFTITITVLIIACPCALGLATPTAITAGIGEAAKKGILVKDASTLEHLKDVDAIFVDKTGTLTVGKPQVIQAEWYDEADSFKSLVANAESQSHHPLAKAIVDHLDVTVEPDAFSITETPGVGIQWKQDETPFYAGKVRTNGQFSNAAWREETLDGFKNLNASLIEFGTDDTTFAFFALKDDLKADAREAVANIQDQGIEVVMLTGDKQGVAQDVAEQAGIQTVKAELLPEDKAQMIKAYQEKGRKIAMVGDGINDAPALALADVGIAMSTGTEVAMESAGITLLKGDITKIAQAIDLSKKVSSVIKQNLFWAFFYNIIAIPIAAGLLYPVNGFLLNPMIAGGAMALSSVTVVANSLRLKLAST